MTSEIRWPAATVQLMVRQYTIDRLSLKRMGELHGVAGGTIRRVLEQQGVAIRGNAEATALTNTARYSRRDLLESHMPSLPAGVCWPWRGTWHQGRAWITLKYQKMSARRAVFEEFVRPIPAGHWVYDTCGDPRCVNPKHLRCGPQAEVIAVMKARGTYRMTIARRMRLATAARRRSALTPEQVEQIRLSSEPAPELAERLNVNPSTINNIRSGRSWAPPDVMAAQTMKRAA